jgi:hypothetical protein
VADLTSICICVTVRVQVEGKRLSGCDSSPSGPSFTRPGGGLLLTVAGPPSPTDFGREGKEVCT